MNFFKEKMPKLSKKIPKKCYDAFGAEKVELLDFFANRGNWDDIKVPLKISLLLIVECTLIKKSSQDDLKIFHFKSYKL